MADQPFSTSYMLTSPRRFSLPISPIPVAHRGHRGGISFGSDLPITFGEQHPIVDQRNTNTDAMDTYVNETNTNVGETNDGIGGSNFDSEDAATDEINAHTITEIESSTNENNTDNDPSEQSDSDDDTSIDFEALFSAIQSKDNQYQSQAADGASKIDFPALPAEIRVQIYNIIFANSRLNLVWFPCPDAMTVLSRSYEDKDKLKILQTSKEVRREAIPIVMLNTTLYIDSSNYRRTATFSVPMAKSWANLIKKVEYGCLPKMKLDTQLFVNVRIIELEHLVYHTSTNEKRDRKDDMMGLILEKIRKKDPFLVNDEAAWLRRIDGVQVTMKVWLIDTKVLLQKGLEIIVDAGK